MRFTGHLKALLCERFELKSGGQLNRWPFYGRVKDIWIKTMADCVGAISGEELTIWDLRFGLNLRSAIKSTSEPVMALMVKKFIQKK